MKPYGLTKKILHNFPDNHPPKGWVNWWECDINSRIRKGSERQLGKKEIIKQLNEIN